MYGKDWLENFPSMDMAPAATPAPAPEEVVEESLSSLARPDAEPDSGVVAGVETTVVEDTGGKADGFRSGVV